MRCEDKAQYGSELLATNAAWLHRAGFPDCQGVECYRHGDHWHYGHSSAAASQACQAVLLPHRWRPARWSGKRRHPSKRPARR